MPKFHTSVGKRVEGDDIEFDLIAHTALDFEGAIFLLEGDGWKTGRKYKSLDEPHSFSFVEEVSKDVN